MKSKNKNTNVILVPQEVIEQKIFLIRGKKVMLDKDLAVLYDVMTGNLNKAVKRNIERFPDDFMFQLSKDEFQNLIFHFGTSKWGGTRKMPMAFTENGVAMLSSVLKSKKAIQVNVQIMRTFTKIRELIISNKELRIKIEEMERKYDNRFRVVFDAIKKILESKREIKIEPSKPIGFRDRKAK